MEEKMRKMELIAPCHFGLEAVLRRDHVRPSVEKREAAGAVGRFHHAGGEAGLAHGGGLLVADKDLTPQWVHEHVPDLLADHERLAEFGRKAWEYGIRNAAEIMARHVLQLAEPSK